MKGRILLVLSLLAITGCNRSLSTAGRVQNDPYFQFVNDVTVPDPLPQDPRRLTTTSLGSVNPPTTTRVNLPEVNPLEIPGEDIRIVGSFSFESLNRNIYQEFVKQGFSGQVELDTSGFSAGRTLFCQQRGSDTDRGIIFAASRQLTPAEKAMCQTQGRQLVEFPIGNDPLVMVVNRRNLAVKDVTVEELANIFLKEKWSDVNPSWPDQIIERFVSAPPSSTLDQFLSVASLERNIPTASANTATDTEQSTPFSVSEYQELILSAPNTATSFYDESLIQPLSTSDYGVGFFIHSVYKQYQRDLKPLAINGVTINESSVNNGSYLFPRQFFLYADAKTMRTNTHISQFINFYLTHANQKIREEGTFFPLNPQEQDRAKMTWLDVMEIK